MHFGPATQLLEAEAACGQIEWAVRPAACQADPVASDRLQPGLAMALTDYS